jgi:2-amino-4-hydroxy-6-hydroxymethyldihydropteridine diphosphokinase
VAKLTLSLGSNQGDRADQLRRARERLFAGLGPPVYVSQVVETPPWGVTDQPPFLNQVVVLKLDERQWPLDAAIAYRTAHRILDVCQRVEQGLGRVRGMPWGPRSIDVDMIFLADLVLETERLSLPHPWWRLRPFVTDLLPDRCVLPHW